MSAPAPDATTHFETLLAQVAQESQESVRPSVEVLASTLAERHGPTVLGVLFYGSCLRAESDEGVLDFWVIVDDYKEAYQTPDTSARHALINPVAPPNVFYLERDYEGGKLRTKYGVISRADFKHGTSPEARHPYIWARFAQPARILLGRDEPARHFLESRLAHAILTLVGRLVGQLPDQEGRIEFTLERFWREAFQRTYDSERRPEAESRIIGLYDVARERYDRVAHLAIETLAGQGAFTIQSSSPTAADTDSKATEKPNNEPVYRLEFSLQQLQANRRRWRMMRPYARFLGLIRLFKTAFTFGDWVPYVLWKLERHTGRKIELTPRQRKHPLIFAWPIILPLVLRRNLR